MTITLDGTSGITFPAGGIAADVATQANQETATSTTTIVTPGRQQFHPSAAKAWVMLTQPQLFMLLTMLVLSQIWGLELGE